MGILPFLRAALWSLCVCIWAACDKSAREPLSFTSSNAHVTALPEIQGTPTDRTVHETVYVCHSPGARKYHLRENCGGLKRCKHEVITMSSSDAEKRGLGLCGFED